MPFNIGNQNAQIVNNVEGDQTVYGGQHVVVTLDQARAAVEALRTAVAQAPLEPAGARAAGRDADEAAAELAKPEPDRSRVAGYLSRLVEILRPAMIATGQLAGLVTPLTTLVTWLGHYAGPLAVAVAGLV